MNPRRCVMKLIKYFVALLIASTAAGEVVLFETDFSSQPEHWYSTEFTYNHPGAYLYWISFGHLSAYLQTGETSEWEQNIFIPDGTDSVRIEIEHNINISGGDYPELTFSVRIGDRDSYEILWYEYVSHVDPNLYAWLSHDVTPEWLTGGDWLGIRFRASGWPGEFGSNIRWTVSHVKVTAYGDELSFTPDTWAAIKGSF